MGALGTHPFICRKTRCKILTTLPKLKKKKKGGGKKCIELKKKKHKKSASSSLCLYVWLVSRTTVNETKGERGEALSIRDATRVQGTKEEKQWLLPKPSSPTMQWDKGPSANATASVSRANSGGQGGGLQQAPLSPSPDIWLGKRHFSLSPCCPSLTPQRRRRSESDTLAEQR